MVDQDNFNDQDLFKLWKSYESKLEETLAVNRRNTIEITKLKISSNLASMKPIKWFTIIVGIVWCFILGSVFSLSLLHHPPHLPFILFMAALMAINGIGVATYIYHLVLINQIDSSGEIIAAQRGLAKLKTSTLSVTRILILQIPFYASFHLFIAFNAGPLFWAVNIPILAAFIALTIWLFAQINYENRDKRWFQFLFDDNEWYGVVKSIEMLEQIEAFEAGA